MKRKSLTARLRNAEKRAAALQKRVNALKAFADQASSEFSGTVIITGLDVGDVSKTAIATARRLGYAVTISPDPSNRGKFSLRAHRAPE